MIGAEEGARIKAGVATRVVAATNRDMPSASQAHGINSTQFCQFVYSKPGALFSVTACQTPRHKQVLSSVCLIGRAMVWISRTN